MFASKAGPFPEWVEHLKGALFWVRSGLTRKLFTALEMLGITNTLAYCEH